MNEVRLLPAREFPLDEAGRTRFRSRFREKFEGDPSQVAHLQGRLATASRPRGIEYYLPLFFERDRDAHRLPAARRDRVRCTATSRGAIERFWQDTRVALPPAARRSGASAAAAARAVPAAGRVLRRAEAVRARRARRSRDADDGAAAPTRRRGAAAAASRSTGARTIRCAALKRVPRSVRRPRAARSPRAPGRRETMQRVLRRVRAAAGAGRRASRQFLAGDDKLHARRRAAARTASCWPTRRLAVVTENELYAGAGRAAHAARRASARTTSRACCATCPRCKIGDPVVHEQHGIGRYSGCMSMDLGEGDDRVPARSSTRTATSSTCRSRSCI